MEESLVKYAANGFSNVIFQKSQSKEEGGIKEEKMENTTASFQFEKIGGGFLLRS